MPRFLLGNDEVWANACSERFGVSFALSPRLVADPCFLGDGQWTIDLRLRVRVDLLAFRERLLLVARHPLLPLQLASGPVGVVRLSILTLNEMNRFEALMERKASSSTRDTSFAGRELDQPRPGRLL